MADFTKLTSDIAALKDLVTALLAKQTPPPADDQPAVDSAAASVEAIIAQIDAPAS